MRPGRPWTGRDGSEHNPEKVVLLVGSRTVEVEYASHADAQAALLPWIVGGENDGRPDELDPVEVRVFAQGPYGEHGRSRVFYQGPRSEP